jgi:hypothetical protein
VQFKRVAIDPEKGDIFSFPVLYMTGQRPFQFSDTARKRLREYLDNGGVLLADCAIGNSDFDTAFRSEIKQIYKDRELKTLPPDHPLFKYVFDTKTVELAPLARQLFGSPMGPRLEAIEVDGTLPVIYSPLSLSGGWEQLPRAYNVGYADEDSLKVGVNILMYVVSH